MKRFTESVIICMCVCVLLITSSDAQEPATFKPGYGHSSPAQPPVAILLGNPKGLWNNDGKGGLNPVCIPFVELIGGSGPPSLSSPDIYLSQLGIVLGSGGFFLYETSVNLHIAGALVYSMWNAVAQYTPTMQPVWPVPGVSKRPASEYTIENQNIAVMYSLLNVIKFIMPPEYWLEPMTGLFAAVGLDIENTSKDPATAVGVGNLVGADVIAKHTSTRWNVLGNLDASTYLRSYSDWTGFTPVNTAFKLNDVLKWQPLVETTGRGYFTIQQHTTPQAGQVTPIMADPAYFSSAISPAPYSRRKWDSSYRAQADKVLAISAALTDKQKMTAEYYDDKFTSFGPLTVAIAKSLGWDNVEYILADMHLPCFADGTALMWREKIRHQAIRPISAVRYLYQTSDVQGWVQGKGTQTMKGREWTSYMRTMPHAEYPSGTSCVCAIYASFMRAMTGTNTFPKINPVKMPAGCSRREPGMTPAADVLLTYATWDDFELDCAQSRAYAGVHFQSSIDMARKLCAPLGTQCYNKSYKLMFGSSSTPGPISKPVTAAAEGVGVATAGSVGSAYDYGVAKGAESAPAATGF